MSTIDHHIHLTGWPAIPGKPGKINGMKKAPEKPWKFKAPLGRNQNCPQNY